MNRAIFRNRYGELEQFALDYRMWIFERMHGDGYSILFDFLYDSEFTWCIPQDANRASDGRYLRATFEYETGVACPDGWEEWPCNVLEMLCALCMKLEDMILYDPPDGTEDASDIFWTMLGNCGLAIFDDEYLLAAGGRAFDELKDTLERVLEREYYPDGVGGFFPLKHPREDQRYVEIWYQANAFAIEQGL